MFYTRCVDVLLFYVVVTDYLLETWHFMQWILRDASWKWCIYGYMQTRNAADAF